MAVQSPEPAEPTRLPRWIAALAAVVGRHPVPVLVGGLVLAALSIYAAVTRLEYRTQRSDLMSSRKDYQQRWRQYLAEFGDDDDMVVVVQGHDRARMRAALDALAAEVRKQPSRFDRLFYQVDLRPLRDRALLYLPEEQITEIRENLRKMSPLLAIGPSAWRLLTVATLLSQARLTACHITPGELLAPGDEQFLAQLLSIVRSAAATLKDPAGYCNPWAGMVAPRPPETDQLAEPQYFFSGDGTLAFLLVRPVKEVGSFTPARASVQAMRGIIAEVKPRFRELELGLTGLPVLENDEMVASEADSRAATWLALLAVGVLYLVVYRGPRYPLLTVTTLVIGTTWALGWLTLTVGHLNILSVTFAVMLIGLGDYGVLWVTRYDEERRLGRSPRDAQRATALSVGPSIFTAAVTTALAFYATMLADFEAVAELGWIAGSGVLLCALASFTMLPAMLALTDVKPTTLPVRPRAAVGGAFLPALSSRPRWVLAGGLAVAAVLAVYSGRVTYDHNLLNLQANGLESVRWEMTLIERTAGASWHALSVTASPEEALALKARYEQLPEVSRVVEVASLIPRGQERKVELLRDIRDRLKNLPERGAVFDRDPPSVRTVQGELKALIGQLTPLALSSPEPLLDDLTRALSALHERLCRVPEATAATGLQAFERRLAADLNEDLHRLRDVSHPAPIALADLPEPLRQRHIGSTGKWLVRAFAKECLWEYGPLEQFAARIRTVDPDATGKPFGTLEGLRSMKSGFEWAGLYALLAIVVVLWLDFRRTSDLLLALVPLALGVVAALGVLALAGVPLNPANMIALPLIVGVGVDHGVHVLHDYRSRPRGKAYSLGSATGQGIMVAALTTMLGFGALMISHHRGLVGLGFVLTLGVGCCMVCSLIVLPALLRVLSKPPRRVRPELPAVLTLKMPVPPVGRRAAA